MTLSIQTGGSDGDSEVAGQAGVCCWGVCSLREPTVERVSGGWEVQKKAIWRWGESHPPVVAHSNCLEKPVSSPALQRARS